MNILFNVEYLLHAYGYLGVFVVVFLESGVIFALPGDSLLFTAGLLASILGLNLPLLILVVFLGAFFGSLAGYFIGYYIDHLRRYHFMRVILKEEYVNEAHAFFKKHGLAAILISRFVPVLRTFTPIAAGVAEMERGSFIRYSFLSALLWSVSVTLAGFYLGRAFPQLKDYISYLIILVVIVSVLPGVWHWQRTRRKRSETT